MNKLLVLLFLFFSQIAISQCDDLIVKLLKGTWVKTSGSADTIKFSLVKNLEQNFELILANVSRPQGGPAGLYAFRTLGTTMLVQWLPSSTSGAQAIPFYFLDKKTRL